METQNQNLVAKTTIGTPMIHKQIIAVMRNIKAVSKNHQGEGFVFRSIDDIYGAVHPLFQKYGIFCVPETLSHQTNALGKTIVECKFTFFAEDGSSISSTTRGEALDKIGSQGTQMAMSIAHKCALVQMFMIPTVADLPWLSPLQFKKALSRITAGDNELYNKIDKVYQMKDEQRKELKNILKK